MQHALTDKMTNNELAFAIKCLDLATLTKDENEFATVVLMITKRYGVSINDIMNALDWEDPCLAGMIEDTFTNLVMRS